MCITVGKQFNANQLYCFYMLHSPRYTGKLASIFEIFVTIALGIVSIHLACISGLKHTFQGFKESLLSFKWKVCWVTLYTRATQCCQIYFLKYIGVKKGFKNLLKILTKKYFLMWLTLAVWCEIICSDIF